MSAKSKYLSVRGSVSGFSFANMGLFTGFADGIYNAVYSLVILEIFRSSAIVGFYVALYAAFCMIVGLFANELFRQFSKVKVFYFSLLMLAVCYAMMGFSIRPISFITLDYTTGIAITLVGVLIPLFMSDFAGNAGMAKLNSRYHLWINVGALFAPMIAVAIANRFDNRSAFFASALIYLLGWMFFKYFKIVQQTPQVKPVNPRRTLRSLWRNTLAFVRCPGMLRAYAINFGYYSLRAMRYLYVPIVVIENGFSKDTLGWVLTLGIIPYLLLSDLMGRLVGRYGKNIWLILGFSSFALFAAAATVVTGIPLLAIFVAWQVSGALMESVHDLMFFDTAKKTEQTRFYGVFRTSVNLPNIVAPILGAICITIFGTTSAVWAVSATIGALSVGILITRRRPCAA
ncbi:MAG: MFS transporter [Alphaproteobacteria bacterium]|nr:MFS transporter [Alphaproteobacteria bacterium]